MPFLGFRYESVASYVFGLSLVTALLLETVRPFRHLPSSTARRWVSNGTLLALCTLVTRGAYQLSGIALAIDVHAARYGLLNGVRVPSVLRVLAGIALLDLTHYFVHRLLHVFHVLWRLHRVHHSETDLDATTGLRFHPAEALITQGVPLLTIALFGVPVVAVLSEGLIVLLQDFFTHANVTLSPTVDRFLRALIITPGMHRIHHSEAIDEQNTNFGTIFSVWDRLFGTYGAALSAGDHARYGVTELAEGSNFHFLDLLLLPFRDPAAGALKDSSSSDSLVSRESESSQIPSIQS